MTDATRLAVRLRSAFGFKSLPFAKDLAPDQAFRTEVF